MMFRVLLLIVLVSGTVAERRRRQVSLGRPRTTLRTTESKSPLESYSASSSLPRQENRRDHNGHRQFSGRSTMTDAEAVVASARASQIEKSPKKKAAKLKKTTSHPKYSDMIKKGITFLNERGGSSRQALLKYIMASYNVDPKAAKVNLNLALRAGVKNGTLKQSKGTGASGSFRIGDKAEKTKKAEKPKVAEAKRKEKKGMKPKAPGVKVSPKRTEKGKAKKPAAAAEKATTSKKAKKPAAAAKKPKIRKKKVKKPDAAVKKVKPPKKAGKPAVAAKKATTPKKAKKPAAAVKKANTPKNAKKAAATAKTKAKESKDPKKAKVAKIRRRAAPVDPTVIN